VFVTGHRKADGELALDFESLIRPGQTVVVYMGLAGLAQLAAGLIAHGMRADMPAALIQQGTTSQQRVLVGSLSELPRQAREHVVQPPTLVIVGEVVRLRERLAWFEPAAKGQCGRIRAESDRAAGAIG
jgi:uroporphyrin-III C-methyltransferase/precorrin-2 dehydrogenase/sirohydrochlorin ferrochelatase